MGEIFKHKLYRERFTVSYEYPVFFTRSVFHCNNPLLAAVIGRKKERRLHRVMVLLDAGMAAANPGIADAITEYFEARSGRMELVCRPVVVRGGERAKNGWNGVRRVMELLGDYHMCRQSVVLAVGGGSVLDMVGFATALVHRGLRLVRIPTTVLAQNDAGIGVKNGMNERRQKNFVGSFAPPFAVINDFNFLRTLKHSDWIGGVSEAFKVAIIKDASFLSFLCRNAGLLKKRDMQVMEQVVTRCAALHLEHIREGGDPFEMGSARPLDFGHWAGHRLEMMSGSRLGHGQAVSIGIALDSCYAMYTGLITKDELHLILDGMSGVGLPVWSPLLERKGPKGRLEVIAGLEQFREHLGGRLAVTLPDGIGRRIEVGELDGAAVAASVRLLKEYHNESG